MLITYELRDKISGLSIRERSCNVLVLNKREEHGAKLSRVGRLDNTQHLQKFILDEIKKL